MQTRDAAEIPATQNPHRFCLAPMMARTDRHCRYFLRLLSRRAMFHTEMISARAVVHGDRERLLGFDPAEQPLTVQFGGGEPETLAVCAGAAREYGYSGINLNAGCPSPRAGRAMMGARLMQDPQRTADCLRALGGAGLPVSLKCRTGVDRRDDYDSLQSFIARCLDAGCARFIVHARKAWLQGLNPRQNREIPPLQYDYVYRLKRDFPDAEIILNGGLHTPQEGLDHLRCVDGVMMGRQIYRRPLLMLEVDPLFYGEAPPVSRPEQVADALAPYMEKQLRCGASARALLRHIAGLCRDLPGGARWRRELSERGLRRDAGLEVLREARRLLGAAAPALTPPDAATVQ